MSNNLSVTAPMDTLPNTINIEQKSTPLQGFNVEAAPKNEVPSLKTFVIGEGNITQNPVQPETPATGRVIKDQRAQQSNQVVTFPIEENSFQAELLLKTGGAKPSAGYFELPLAG